MTDNGMIEAIRNDGKKILAVIQKGHCGSRERGQSSRVVIASLAFSHGVAILLFFSEDFPSIIPETLQNTINHSYSRLGKIGNERMEQPT